MATLDEERYLRNLLLFGEGGMLLLRHLVVQEELKSGQTLKTILLTNKHLFNGILREQRLVLYPSRWTANIDLNTWDMSILLLVVKRLFSAGLPHAVVSNIAALKAYRNSLQGHPNNMSMNNSEYTTNQALLQGTLRNIADHVHQRAQIESIITRTESGSIDIRSVIRQIKETQAFSFSIQSMLGRKLRPINQKLSHLEKHLKTANDKHDAYERNRKEDHEETKRCLRRLQESTADYKQDMNLIRGSVASSKINQEEAYNEMRGNLQSLRVSSEDSKHNLATVVGHVRKFQRSSVQRAKYDFTKDLDTIIQAESENEEKQMKATDLLFTFVQIIQNDNLIDDKDIKHIIAQRVRWYDGELTLQLLDDMMEWFGDINKHCDGTGKVRRGSIHLPIFCSSVTGLFNSLGYITSNQCKQRLSTVSLTISKIFGASCKLSWKVEHTSLQIAVSSFLDNIRPESRNLEKLILPFHATDMKQLTHVWKMFGGEDRNLHLEKVSETLSKIFGETILLTTSVDRYQLLEAVKHTDEDKKWIIDRSPFAASTISPDAGLKSPPDSLESKKDPKFNEVIQDSASSSVLGYLSGIDIPIEIRRIVATPDSRLLAITRKEPNLLVFDSSFKVVNNITLPGLPIDLCYTGEDKAAVCLDLHSIAIVSTKKECIFEIFQGSHRYLSISSQGNLLHVIDNEGHVYTFDTTMKILSKHSSHKEFVVDYVFPMDSWFGFPKRIAVSTDEKMIYINNKRNIFRIDDLGNSISKLFVNYPVQDICVMDDGTILICSYFSRDLLQIDMCGEEVLRKIQIPKTFGNILAMCYIKANSRLLIADKSSRMHVFKLRLKAIG